MLGHMSHYREQNVKDRHLPVANPLWLAEAVGG